LELSKEKKIGLVSLFVLTLIFVFLLLSPSQNHIKYPIAREFQKVLLQNSLYSNSKNIFSVENITNEIINSDLDSVFKKYMNSIDMYGKYFTQEEYASFTEAMKSQYMGIGMFLYQQKHDNRIFCIPFEDRLLKSGVDPYDQLISVDGKSVKNQNIYIVSSWIRGEENIPVTIEIKKSSTLRNVLTIKREIHDFNSVQWIEDNGTTMLQIIHFTQETPKELSSAIDLWPLDIPVVIDLRDNSGGDYLSAVNSADLFLSKDTLISELRTKNKTTVYVAKLPDILKGREVILLQNSLTASAAEVFISALCQNLRAVSIGDKTYGKGVAQKFFELSNNSAILLTYAKIFTPDGTSYDELGLEPTSKLSIKNLLNEYMEEKIDVK
jgi:carboxyl-terminal processing protease